MLQPQTKLSNICYVLYFVCIKNFKKTWKEFRSSAITISSCRTTFMGACAHCSGMRNGNAGFCATATWGRHIFMTATHVPIVRHRGNMVVYGGVHCVHIDCQNNNNSFCICARRKHTIECVMKFGIEPSANVFSVWTTFVTDDNDADGGGCLGVYECVCVHCVPFHV